MYKPVCAILLLCWGAWVNVAWAGILNAGILEDQKGQLTISEVSEREFSRLLQNSEDTLARGYTQSVFWVRLEVAAHKDNQYLRVRPPYLDHVTLYVQNPDDLEQWRAIENGDRIPMIQRQVWGVSLLFTLPPADSIQTVYLRLQTQSSSLMNFEVLTLPEFQQQEFHIMLLQLVLIAVMLGLFIWAAFDFIVSRQRIVGVFLLVQLAQMGYVLAIGGYLPMMVASAVLADQLTSLLVALTVVITLVFHRLLVAEFEPNRWVLRLLNTMIAISVISAVSILAGKLQFGLPLTSSLVVLLIPMLLWLAYSARRDQLTGLTALRITYCTLALVLCFVMAPLFGVWVSFDLYIWATTTQGLFTGFVMAVLLFRRSLALQRLHISDQLQLARVQEKLLSEQARAADQRQFLDMLAHELRTPLGVIQLTLGSVDMSDTQEKRLRRSLDTMSAVIDRCRLSLQLDEGKLNTEFKLVDITSAVHDLVLSCKEPERIVFREDGPLPSRTDLQLFQVILHNLLDNAMKYSLHDTPVTVSTAACQHKGVNGVCVTVHNHLVRALAVDPDTLFEKYFRGVNATGQTGSGLGLHLSKRLANIINGHLWAEIGPNDIKLCLWIPPE